MNINPDRNRYYKSSNNPSFQAIYKDPVSLGTLTKISQEIIERNLPKIEEISNQKGVDFVICGTQKQNKDCFVIASIERKLTDILSPKNRRTLGIESTSNIVDEEIIKKAKLAANLKGKKIQGFIQVFKSMEKLFVYMVKNAEDICSPLY